MIWKPMFSEFSLFMALLLFTVQTVVFYFLSKKVGWHALKMMGAGILLAIVRCLLPVEFPGAKIIHIKGFISKIYIWARTPWQPGYTPAGFLLFIWMGGSFILFCHLGWTLWRQKKRGTTAIPLNHPFYSIYMDALQEMACPQKGSLSVSPTYRTVVMTGFFRPDIGIPEHMEEVSESELKYIFKHELSHFLHHDLWIKLFVEILRCLLWWNPAAYLLRSCVSQLLEMRCDSCVCRDWSMEQRTAYSATLIKMFRKQTGSTPTIFTSYLGQSGKSHVKQRFKQILYTEKQTRKANILSWVAILAIVIFFVLSYTFIFLPAGSPSELETGEYSISSDGETEFILRYPDGRLELFLNKQLYAILTSEELNNEKFSDTPVYNVNIAVD